MNDKNRLKMKFFLLFPLCVLVVGLTLFLPAGTLDYPQGWLFMVALFTPFIFTVTYFLKHDMELLKRRMKFKEKEAKEKIIVKISGFLFFIGFLFCGFDYRHGYSSVPILLSLISDVIIILGYVVVFFVFKENSYTSRTIEVESGQKVITTGPYSFVRHPMYVGVILMYLFMPMALGSYYALAFFVPSAAMIILRILDEERILLKELSGYKVYCDKVRYRLIPKIW